MREPDQGRAAEVARLTSAFRAAGAELVEPDYLQPAELLLDLYGEEIRARAYRTDDPVHGEQMLRPDFTVPIVEAHLATGAAPCRYTYAGPVWRRQEYGSAAAREFWQVGFEVFDTPAATADAEVFALIAELVGPTATPILGDLAFIFAAIDGLKTTEARRAALRRHVWRPNRFKRLLDRFAAPASAEPAPMPPDGDIPGLRSRAEITARLERLAAEQATPPLTVEEVALLRTILAMRGTTAAAAAGLAALARDFPGLKTPLAGFNARLEAIAAQGIAPDALAFDASLGRTTMEYYDGFTFVFRAPSGADVATGGRYDALTRALGSADAAAVGGVIRPGLLARLRGTRA